MWLVEFFFFFNNEKEQEIDGGLNCGKGVFE